MGANAVRRTLVLGVVGIVFAVSCSPAADAQEDPQIRRIWRRKTDTVFSVSVSEEGHVAFSEGTRDAGFIRIYSRKDDSVHSWKCESADRVVVCGNHVFAAYNTKVLSLFRVKPSEQLWAKQVDSLNPLSLDYSCEAKRGVLGNMPLDSAFNPAASSVWVFDEKGDVVWQKRLNVHLTCAAVNEKGYVIVAGERFGPLDESFEYTKGENAVYIFDPLGNQVAHVMFDSPPIDVAPAGRAETFAVEFDDGRMVLLDGDGKVLWEKEDLGGYVAIDGRGERIVTTKSVRPVLLDRQGRIIWEGQEEVFGGPEGLAISPNARYVGVTTVDNAVVILEGESGKTLYKTKAGKKVSRVSLSNSYAGVSIEGEVQLLSLK